MNGRTSAFASSKFTAENKCAYWKNADEIVELNEASANFDSIAATMKKLGQALYSWKNIAEKYNALF